MYLLKTLEIVLNSNYFVWGILPRTVLGLRGILFSPFIHSDSLHLLSNTIPFLVLLTLIFYFYKRIAVRILIFSFLLEGILVWLFARNSYHIGASGLVYAFFGFIAISGLIRRQIPLLSISLLIIFLYGGLVWGVLPQEKHISWESHLFGLLVGLVLAIYYKAYKMEHFNNSKITDDEEYKTEFWNDLIEE